MANTAYTITDPYANQNRYVRYGSGEPRAGLLDLTIVPARSGTSGILLCAGDIIYQTAGGKFASLNTPGTGKANTAAHCGVAIKGYPDRLAPDLLRGQNDAVLDPADVVFLTSGEFRFRCDPGETFVPGITPVYLDVDAQTVTGVATNNGTALGIVATDQRPLFIRPELTNSITGTAEIVIVYKPAIVV